MSLGRRFWARRVGFSARCDYLRPQIMDNAKSTYYKRLEAAGIRRWEEREHERAAAESPGEEAPALTATH